MWIENMAGLAEVTSMEYDFIYLISKMNTKFLAYLLGCVLYGKPQAP